MIWAMDPIRSWTTSHVATMRYIAVMVTIIVIIQIFTVLASLVE